MNTLEKDVTIKSISKPLLTWYDSNRRTLPWREEPTPYRVWVSEIMLQQTRVEAVKPYFERFMKALPDIEALAGADEERLLKLWEGLGYYNRVRNLQKAAKQIMADYGGAMPADHEKLLSLSGIGSYTAGAIASIAFGIPKPAVDGNVLRVLARIRMDDRSISDSKVKQAVEAELEAGMPGDRPGDFNQAMMDIGAMICLPNGTPRCGDCPLAALCRAHESGKELLYPKKEAKKLRTIEEKTLMILKDENKIALQKRSPKGLLAGMYEFPSMAGFHTAAEVLEFLSEKGIHAIRIMPLADSKHIFTHREWHMKCFLVKVDELEKASLQKNCKNWIFVAQEETVDQYPIPSAFAAYSDFLRQEKPAVTKGKPVFSRKKPVATKEKPVISGKNPVATKAKSDSSGKKPEVDQRK